MIVKAEMKMTNVMKCSSLFLQLFFLLCITLVNAFANELPLFLKNNQTKIENPMELRDPFKSDVTATDKTTEKTEGLRSSGDSFSNIPTIELDRIPLNRIVIVGTLMGPKRLATAKVMSETGGMPGPNDPSFIIREGMILGTNKAEVRAIVHGGIVLVEKIRNAYDQDEYIETIIPLIELEFNEKADNSQQGRSSKR